MNPYNEATSHEGEQRVELILFEGDMSSLTNGSEGQ